MTVPVPAVREEVVTEQVPVTTLHPQRQAYAVSVPVPGGRWSSTRCRSGGWCRRSRRTGCGCARSGRRSGCGRCRCGSGPGGPGGRLRAVPCRVPVTYRAGSPYACRCRAKTRSNSRDVRDTSPDPPPKGWRRVRQGDSSVGQTETRAEFQHPEQILPPLPSASGPASATPSPWSSRRGAAAATASPGTAPRRSAGSVFFALSSVSTRPVGSAIFLFRKSPLSRCSAWAMFGCVVRSHSQVICRGRPAEDVQQERLHLACPAAGSPACPAAGRGTSRCVPVAKSMASASCSAVSRFTREAACSGRSARRPGCPASPPS